MRTPGLRLLLFSLLLCFRLTAQHYVVTGYVLNPLDEPVPKALVTLENASTSTNSKGFFTIRTEILPSVLTVKHSRYNAREYFVNLPQPGLDSVFVTVYLDNKSTDLEEFTVSASRVMWAYPKKGVHVIDFELQQNGMVLLCKDDNNYLVRLVNELNEPLYDLPIRRHPKGLFRDCTGNLHILYPDSAYQVAIIRDSILRQNGVRTTDNLRQTLLSCALSVRNSQVYQYEGNSRQSIDFVLIDTLSHKVARLYTAKNRKYMRAIDEYHREVERDNRSLRDPLGQNTVDDQLILQAALEKQALYEKLLMRPAYVPAYRVRDSIVVFDHLNDTAVVFNRQGHRVRSYPIIYHHHPKWDAELIVSEEGDRLFARCDYRGMAHLLEINPVNGQVIREIELVQHIYPSKIQVRGNFVYYIFHHYIDYSINYVYKQRIE